jgi:hypothetical protein
MIFTLFLRLRTEGSFFNDLSERPLRDRPQLDQRHTPLFGVQLQLFGYVATQFVVAAISEAVTGFFKNSVHIRERALTQITHSATSPSDQILSASFARVAQVL